MQRQRWSRNNNTCSELKLPKRGIWPTFRHGGGAAVVSWRSLTVSKADTRSPQSQALQTLSSRCQEVTATLWHMFPKTSLSFHSLVAGSPCTVGLTGLTLQLLFSWVDRTELLNNFLLSFYFPILPTTGKKETIMQPWGRSTRPNSRNLHNYLIPIS